jgi:hypothetical protein
MASFASIVQVQVARQGKKAWCNVENACPKNPRGYTGIEFMNVTFEIVEEYHAKQITVIMVTEYLGQSKLLQYLEIGKMHDVFVLNQGLHYMDGRKKTRKLLLELRKIKPALYRALSKNITIFWRETTAVHFNTIDGYWNNNIGELQSNHSVVCVPSSAINAPVSYKNANGIIVPFMKTLGIPVLSAWEASFFIPEMCHVGEGRDCLHFLLPGGPTTYFNEVLIQHILDLA